LVFTNFNKVFPVVVLVFDEFSDGMLNPYWYLVGLLRHILPFFSH
jgi:hypothetical protein